MSKKSIFKKYRTITVLSFFAAALIVVGIVLRSRIGVFLDSYTESQTKKQAETFALLMGEKFNTELENLEYIAARLEASLDNMDDIMPTLLTDKKAVQGLLDIDGNALYGKSLDASVFEGIQSSFRGNSDISYVEGEGLLFTCPVFNGSNIRYVLYRMCPSDVLAETYATEIYDDLGKFCVSTREGQIIVPINNGSKEDTDWYMSENIQNNFNSMHLEMEISVSAARCFSTDRGEMILFESEIPGTNYLISGFVPKSVASEGVGNITLLVVWVFGLLMVLVMLGAFYLTKASVKIRESNELREAKALAEEASRAKSDFLANMSHEIRTPINAVLGMNEMIIRESSDETITTYASNIRTAGNTLLGIINDILDFSKIEAGKIEITPANYDLANVIGDLVNMISTRADNKGLELKLNFDRSVPKKLYGDEVRIKQIITNILTNAVKYTEKGSVSFHIGYERIDEKPDFILLYVSVKDTGIGIKEEDMKKLFSEFERIEEERNRNIEGTGLGMNITKRLLEMMDSTLKVESVYGQGSNFHFSLRQKVVEWVELGNYEDSYKDSIKEKSHYKEKFVAPEAKVLVVDDNPMNLMVLKSLLKRTQIQIDTALSGNEGLELTAANKYDIIFLDHMMPEKDGIETLHELRLQWNSPNIETPAICLTANAISGAKEKYLQEGFNDYLTKPVDTDELENMIISFISDEKIIKPDDERFVTYMAKNKVTNNGKSTEKTGEHLSGLPDFLMNIEEIDIETGITNNGKDEKAYLDTLTVYASTIDKYVDEIQTFYQQRDIKNLTIKIHALKSTSRIIGAVDIGELAEKLENAGNENDTETLYANLPGLLERCLFLGKILQPLTGEKEDIDDHDLPLIEEDVLIGYLEKIHNSAEDCADIEIEDLLEELSHFRIPDDKKELVEQIKTALNEFDFEKIAAIV